MSFSHYPYSRHFGQESKLSIFFQPPTFSRFQLCVHWMSLAIFSLTGHLTLMMYVIFLAGDGVSLNSSDDTKFCERRMGLSSKILSRLFFEITNLKLLST